MYGASIHGIGPRDLQSQSYKIEKASAAASIPLGWSTAVPNCKTLVDSRLKRSRSMNQQTCFEGCLRLLSCYEIGFHPKPK